MSTAVYTAMGTLPPLTFAKKKVVPNPNGPASTTPDGASFTVPVWLVNPAEAAVMVGAPEPARACAKYVALKPPVGIVTVIDLRPTVVPVADSNKIVWSLLVSVIATPPAGAAWPIETLQLACRLLPIMTPSQVEEMPFEATFAVTVVSWAGAPNPGGVLTDSTVDPGEPLVKVVALLDIPPVNESVAGEMVPTLVLELATVTLAEWPTASG